MGACRARFEREFCLQVLDRLSADSARALWELATGEDGFLQELKSDPGQLGLETLLEEIVKLRRAKALGLPADLFGTPARPRTGHTNRPPTSRLRLRTHTPDQRRRLAHHPRVKPGSKGRCIGGADPER